MRLPSSCMIKGGLGRVLPRVAVGVVTLFALLFTVGAMRACETPVYRYAMYRWQPTPYEVYAFHDTSSASAHAEVEKAIADVSEGTDNRANVVFIPVNLTADPELNSVTPDIKQAWLAQESPEIPSFLISTPYGVQIHAGAFTADTVKELVESPARKQLAQQLEAGKIGVLLMLSGQDKQQNEQTRQILAGLVKEVGEGKISLYTAPTDVAGGEPPTASGTPGLELGLIEVNRDDEDEAWLVRSLLAMESDLPSESRPMVFLTYGRGRALLPYIGEGITRENLIREVEFISGACSCTVKEQNPGVDLLVRYDWDAASAALADRFGTEEGNESQFGPSDFLPQLIIPSSAAVPTEAVATTGDEATDAGSSELTAIPAGDTSQDDEPSNDTNASLDVTRADGVIAADISDGGAVKTEPLIDAATDEEQHGEAAASSMAPGENVASLTPAEAVLHQSVALPNQRTYLGMLVVAGGLALGMVILIGLTFFVMRPR